MKVPRGIRNNNPGNIERSPANKWQGRADPSQMTPDQRLETRFEVFVSPPWGIRALAIVLINYQDKHGCGTVRQIITRWAPPSENDTEAYIGQVCKALNVKPNEPISTHDYRILRPLVETIIRHENGQQPYNDQIIEEGLRLAGVVNPGAAPLVPAPRAATAAAATAAAAGGAAAIAEGLQQVLPALQTASHVAVATNALPSFGQMIAGGFVLIAGMVFNPDNHNNKVVLSGTSQWDDASSDPTVSISDALDNVIVRPNIAVFGQTTWTKLRRNVKLVQAIKGTSQGAGQVSRREFADYFELSAVYVGASFINLSKRGQPVNMSRVWGKHAAFIYRDRTAGPQAGMTYGFTAHFGNKISGTIPEPKIGLTGSIRVRTGDRLKEVITAKDLSYFFQNAVK